MADKEVVPNNQVLVRYALETDGELWDPKQLPIMTLDQKPITWTTYAPKPDGKTIIVEGHL